MSSGPRTRGIIINTNSPTPHSKSSYIKALLLAASSMTVMAGAIISPALPGIDTHFPGHSDVMVKLVLTMPALMITLFGAPMGYLADRFGRIRLLVLALLLYGIAGSAGFLLDNFNLLLLTRAGLGIAVAGIMSVSTTLIGDYFEADERTRFLGTQGSFMALGGIVFLNLGGVLAEWSWRGPFLVYLLGLALAPLVWHILFEPAPHAPADPSIHTTQNPQTIDRFNTVLAFALGLIGMLLFYMIPAQLPFLLTQTYGSSSTAIGMAVSVATISAATVSFNYGRIKRRLSVMAIYVMSFLFVFVGFTVIGLANNFPVTVLGIAISGLGFGLFMPNGNVWIMSITPQAARGRIIGGFSSVIFLGQFLSPLAVAPLAARFHSLQLVYLAAAVFSLLLGLALLLLRPHGKNTSGQ